VDSDLSAPETPENPALAVTDPNANGRVVFVPTPIGNLGDMTLRGLEVLRQADCIACEDTRHSGMLLKHFEIPAKPLLSLHEHNEARRSQEIVARVTKGECVAVLSDAGMPGISDPGTRLVTACIHAGLAFDVLPGPCALIQALVGSGMPTEEFYFGGFLPTKKGQRTRLLTEALERQTCTSIFYETPHRILSTLQLIATIDDQHRLCLARELTKKFESWYRGGASELLNQLTSSTPRGEMVLLIAPRKLPAYMRRESNLSPTS